MNTMKTIVLMTAMTVLIVLIGNFIGGQNGMVVAFAISLVINFGSYWFSDKIVLSMYGAKEANPAEAPELYSIVGNLVQRANLPMPKIYIIPTQQPNAFATGRNPHHAAVAVTQGILQILDTDELEGVLAHELAHVKHRDILIGTVAATMAGIITMLSRFAFFFGGDSDNRRNPIVLLLTLILAPIAALLIQMAISRSREYLADEGGARMSGKPWALANALNKMERSVKVMPMNASQETSHMFIVSPFSAKQALGLFSTHPSTADRITRLQSMRM